MSKNTIAVKTHGYSYVASHVNDVKGAILLVTKILSNPT